MKKFLFITFILLNILSFATIIYIHEVDINIPQQMFNYTGTRSNMIYYLELFNDGNEKGYLVMGWYFTPVTPIENTQIFIEYDNVKFEYTIDNKISSIYSNIPLHLIICPAKATITVGSLTIPNLEKESGVSSPFPKISEIGLFTFTIKNGEIMLKNYFTQDEEIYILISAGLRKTGGFLLEISSYEIRGTNITIEGSFSEPQKGTPVIQAFTYPSVQIKIGKLKKGTYKIKAVIEKLGNFEKTITVK
ncbi:MAG: protease complex subunit PrcB family protein [Thermosipho sp. (in: Bacteria)]|nr:protease complex subunit PrcB family protein [Thermosipho sp. (in: thermotogales)]